MKKKTNDKKHINAVASKLSSLKDELISRQKYHIDQLNGIIKFQQAEINELKSFIEEEAKEYDRDLFFNAFLIQLKRLDDKKRNPKLKRIENKDALILANRKLNRYRESDLTYPLNGPMKPKLEGLLKRYQDKYKKRLMNDKAIQRAALILHRITTP